MERQLPIIVKFEVKQERLNFALNAYSSLIKFKSDTEYKEKADKMYASIETELQQFSK